MIGWRSQVAREAFALAEARLNAREHRVTPADVYAARVYLHIARRYAGQLDDVTDMEVRNAG